VSNFRVVSIQPPTSEAVKATAARLRRTREALGLTVQQIADLFGISRQAVTNWELAYRLPDPAAMIRLYERYGVPTDWIYLGRPNGLPYELAVKLVDPDANPSHARGRAG
jgi:transcriptional regulator with XRE-family HTH domain